MLQLTFLGTSSGIPTKYRNVSGLAVECINPYLSKQRQLSKNNRPWVLIDCGEGTQHQLLHTKLSVHQLQAICITHVHGDHCYGLAGLLASMAMSGRKEPLELIAPKAIDTLLQALQITTELYLPYDIEFIAIEDYLIENNKICLAFHSSHKLTIDIVPLSHRVASYAFVLSQNLHKRSLKTEKLNAENVPASKLWGQLQQGEDVTTEDGRLLRSEDYVFDENKQIKIVIGGDNDEPKLLTKAVQGANLLVHEATYTQEIADKILLREDNSFNPQHSTAKQVAEFATQQGLSHLILTHFSARYQMFEDVNEKIMNMGHLRAEVNAYYQGKFWLAKDFDKFVVDKNVIKCTS
ncbi:MAG: ribonuclease Z [Moraxellaceae bacterium]|nr:ribonuclease Z [Moraxellaceae bacterium]